MNVRILLISFLQIIDMPTQSLQICTASDTMFTIEYLRFIIWDFSHTISGNEFGTPGKYEHYLNGVLWADILYSLDRMKQHGY